MKRTQKRMTILWGILLVCVLGLGIMCPAIASAQESSAEAVHFNTLIGFLPEAPRGWDGEDPFGQTFTTGEGTWSMAMASYTESGNEEITADVGIMDSVYQQVGWWAAWQGFYSYESSDGYAKTVTVEGYPAWEAYNKDDNQYVLYVGINDRFMVFVNTNSDRDTLYDFADAIDFDGIADLGGDGGAAPPTTTTRPTSPAETTGPAEPDEEGEESETPGFELVAAVIGLLAIFALVRRRA
ncbi:MAG: PGF-CTERM sorting domain-containing protein [Candidatus Methanospirareceae archaeon]